jgi:hypothetical protein
MTDATHDPIWSGFREEWGHWIPELFTTPDTFASLTGKVPGEWLDAVKQPGPDTIAKLWRSAADDLPRFSGYLANEILGLAIGKGDIGHVLIYFLRSCVERPLGVYHPGFLFGGRPLSRAALDEFEREHGKLPASLVSLWSVHDFMRTKDEGTVASLDPASHAFAGAPRRRPSPLHAADDPGDVRDCLAVVDPGSSSSLCLTRRPGENAWADRLVRVFSHDDVYIPAAWATLDDMLTDWERSDYRPGQ